MPTLNSGTGDEFQPGEVKSMVAKKPPTNRPLMLPTIHSRVSARLHTGC